MNLHEVNQSVLKSPDRKRVGRGQGSGWGCTAGRGTKGACSKSGWRYKIFREGGQMPLARRIPKRGFNNQHFRLEWSFVNLGDLNAFKDGELVELESCVAKGLVPRVRDGLKVLGHGDLERKVSVKAHRISASARRAIESKGGTVQLLDAPGDKAKSDWRSKRGKGKSSQRREIARAKTQKRGPGDGKKAKS